MKQNLWRIFVVLTILFIAACTQDEATPDDGLNEQSPVPEQNTSEQMEEEATLPNLESSKKVNVTVEGMAEERTAHLFQSQVLGFSTYIPENLLVDEMKESLIAYGKNMEGTGNEETLFKISKASANSKEELQQELEADGFNVTSIEDKRHVISNYELKLDKEGTSNPIVGIASQFEHEGQWYTMIYFYPVEYAEGFGPSVRIILDEIVWH